MNTFFNKVLIFTGLRKDSNYKSTEYKGLVNFFKRNIISSKKSMQDITYKFSQPRTITRNIYEKTYKRSLSPSFDDEIVEIPNIVGLNNVKENKELNKQFRKEILKNKIKKNFLISMSWFYTIFINLCLFFQPLYTFIYVIKHEKNLSLYAPILCFDLLYPIQYTFGILYFGKDHVENFYIEKKKYININFPDLDKVVFFCIIFVLIFMIFNFISLYTSYLASGEFIFQGFEDLNKIQKILVTIFLIFSWFIGRLTLIIHISVFCLIFCKHCLILKEKVKKIHNKKEMIQINNLSLKILEIRHDLENSIENFSNFFSVLTLLGAISIGFLIEQIKTGQYNNFPWISLIFYSIFQILFLILVLTVDGYREKLFTYIRSGNFVKKYLCRYSEKDTIDKFGNNTQMILLNIGEENSTTMDWVVLNSILTEGWHEFRIFGIPVNNFGLVKRGIALVALLLTFQSYFSD